jgi:ABC-2 type transport system permease protein
MSWLVLRMELRRSRALGLWMALVAAGYGALMAGFYPVIRDNTKLLDDYLKVFPKALIVGFGMEGSLSDHGVFFNTYISSILWPVAAAIVATIVGTRAVAADLERGFVELPLATRIDRVRYLAACIGAQLVVIAVVALATVVGPLAAGGIVAAGFDTGRFLLVVPLLVTSGCAIAGVATVLSVVTLSRAVSAGIVAGGLTLMYLVDIVSRLEPDLGWLGTISFFHYTRTIAVIDQGLLPLDSLVVIGSVAIVTWGAALWGFHRRDLVV